MSPADARLVKVAAEIDRDWRLVERHAQRAAAVDPAASGPEAAWVALALDHAYQAFEPLPLRIEAALGLPAREGSTWHTDLLRDACLDLRGLRPALVPEDVHHDWAALLRFRHFLRHAYGADLEADELTKNVERLTRAVGATAPRIEMLCATLEPSSTPGDRSDDE